MKFPKKQAQRLIPEYLLDYTTKLNESHPDPTESWGGGSGGSYTSGDGINISSDNVISVDNTVALKSDLPTKTSDLTNDSDFTTQTWVENQGYSKFSGSYNDLNDKPDLSIYAQSSNLSTVATTGSYNDLTDKPTIPTNYVTTDTIQTINITKYFGGGTLVVDDGAYTLSHHTDMFQFVDGTGVIDFELPISKPKGNVQVPAKYTLATIDDIPTVPTLATVATTGSYNDLIDKPTIPEVPTNYVTTDTTQTISGAKTFNGGLITENTTFGMKMNIVPSRFQYDYNNQGTIERTLFDLPTEKTPGTEQEPKTYTIATTDDIPTVNNPTITFTQGGTTKGTITLNQSGDQTIEFDAGGSSGGGKLYLHKIHLKKFYLYDNNDKQVGMLLHLYNNITTSSNQPMTFDTYKGYFRLDTTGYDYGFSTSGRVDMGGASSVIAVSFTNNNLANIQYFQYKNSSSSTSSTVVKFDSVDGFEDIVTEV